MLNRICPLCGKDTIYTCYASYYSAKSRNSMCKSCRTSRNNKSRNSTRENNPAWKGYKEIPYNWFSRYFERKKGKRTGDITIEQVYDLWIKQGKKCCYTGLDIGFYDDGNTHNCSIDRIDSNKEYTLDNICLVHKDINIMKNKYSKDYFVKMCQLVAGGKCEV